MLPPRVTAKMVSVHECSISMESFSKSCWKILKESTSSRMGSASRKSWLCLKPLGGVKVGENGSKFVRLLISVKHCWIHALEKAHTA